MNLLLVEDDDDHALLVERQVRLSPFDRPVVFRCGSLGEAIDSFRISTYDAVLLDLGLPESSGLQTLHHFLSVHPTATVIVLTAEEDPEVGLEAIRIGAQEYLTKTETSHHALYKTIRYATERAKLIQKLKTTNESLKAFASAASHDLLAPARQVRQMMEFLLEDHGLSLTSDGRELATRAIAAAHRMTTLTTDLLAFARLDGSVESETVCLENIVAAAADNLSDLIESTRATLTIDVAPTCLYINQSVGILLVQNLIQNALKYVASEPPRISVRASHDEGLTHLFVTDNGIGIPQESFAKIFEPLARLHGAAQFPGSGLGLASCKRIVDSYGGTITVESTVGEGSTFQVSLPLPVPNAQVVVGSETLEDGPRTRLANGRE